MWSIEWDLIIYLRLNTEPEDGNYFIYQFLNGCDWFHFYDFVEFVAIKLQEFESNLEANSWKREKIGERGFNAYKNSVNRLFVSANVGWRMNEQGRLRRESTKALDGKLQAIQNQLNDEYEPAREHYRKAIRYLNERPLDVENSIKETISAIESIGRIIYPSTNTLGDVVKELRKTSLMPSHLVAVIEKFYAYACSEPAVRHGSPVSSRVLLEDAEFTLHLGAALIRYLVSARKRGDS